MKMSYLYGSRLGTVVDLLRVHGIEPTPGTWRALGAISVMATANSLLSRRERVPVDVEVVAPVFILGHWRSGTTHLQYLLAHDPQLATPNTYEVCFPHTLISGESNHGRALAPLLPARRVQDRMAFGMGVPNEDEIALAAMGLPSVYHYWAFPRSKAIARRHLTLEPGTIAPHERARFKRGFHAYLQKLTLKHGRRLLLKSPAHTARVGLLREMYPQSKFVHMHRHPYDVFQSTLHLHRTWREATAFLQPAEEPLDELVLETHRQMYEAFFAAEPHIPDGHHVFLSYDALITDPLGSLDRVYRALDLGPPPVHAFSVYLEAQHAYRKNEYAPLDWATRQRVHRAWGATFERFGYSSTRS